MPIYPPTPAYSETDKRLLSLMAKLLLECVDSDAAGSNLPSGVIALTDKEADELINRLEDLLNSRGFIEACYFVEGLTLPGEQNESRLREIYLSARKRRGRSRALASIHWSEFRSRLGIKESPALATRTVPMDFEYFKKMEERLLSTTGIHPRVITLIMRVVSSQAQQLEQIRRGQRSLQHGTVKPLVADPIFRWREQRSQSRDLRISTTKIAAAITIVANISVLFTTRDWSVTGTLSTMVGALAAAAADDPSP